MANQQSSPANGQLIDFYEVLQVSPTAPLDTIFDAYLARWREIEMDNDLDLSMKETISILVDDAYKVLSNAQYRIKYDVTRLLKQGKISFESPLHDFPSREVAKLRVKVALDLLRKTLQYVAKAYHDADNKYLDLEPDQVEYCEENFITSMDEMEIFTAHILIQITTCERAADFLANSASDGEWAWDIRDSRTESCKVLADLQAAEMRLHKYYWPQFAKALRKGKKSNPLDYSKRLVKILGYIRYANEKTDFSATSQRAQEYREKMAPEGK